MTLGRFLAAGTLDGRWNLAHFDHHSPETHLLELDRERSAAPQPSSAVISGYNRPVMRYPRAGEYIHPTNIARDWIEANPAEWQSMLSDALERETSQPRSTSQTAAAALP
jgi:hypothetical protein